VLWPVLGLPWRATSPMAKLELLASGLRIGPNGRALGFIIPTWEVDWRHIDAIEEASNGISVLTQGHRIKFLVLASRATRQGIIAQIETARAAS